MAPKARTRWRLMLLITLIGLLCADFYIVRTRRMPLGRKTAMHFSYMPFRRVQGQIELATDIGPGPRWSVQMSLSQSSTSPLWAPTRTRFMAVLDSRPMDTESMMTSADWRRLRPLVADHRGKADAFDPLIRTGAFPTHEILPWGYVHNAVAALMALGIVACITGIIRDRFIAARNIKRSYQGLCVACGYPSPASGVCPECGTGVRKDAEGPSGEASA